ncbi:hypothetical protein Tco_1160408 [Tanacetum coccineum]
MLATRLRIFTRCEPSAYIRDLLENLDTLEAVIHKVVNTYGVFTHEENIKPVGSFMLQLGLYQKAVVIEPENNDAFSKLRRVITHMQKGKRKRYICQSFKGKTQSLVTKKTDISYVRSSRNSNLMNMLQKMFGQNSLGLVLHLDDA